MVKRVAAGTNDGARGCRTSTCRVRKGLADRVQVDATIENSSPDYLAEKNARECRQLPRAWQFQTRRRQRRTNAPNASRMRARTECDYRRKYAGLRRSLPTVTVSRVANDTECKRQRVGLAKTRHLQ